MHLGAGRQLERLSNSSVCLMFVYIDAGMKDGDSQVDRSEKENWRAKRA